MGARFGSSLGGPVVTVLPANGANTLVCTSSIMVTPHDSAAIFVAYFINLLMGAGTLTLNLYLVRGPTLSSPLISPSGFFYSVTPGSTYMISGSYVDVAFSGTTQYSLTVITNATTAPCTLYDAALLAYIL